MGTGQFSDAQTVLLGFSLPAARNIGHGNIALSLELFIARFSSERIECLGETECCRRHRVEYTVFFRNHTGGDRLMLPVPCFEVGNRRIKLPDHFNKGRNRGYRFFMLFHYGDNGKVHCESVIFFCIHFNTQIVDTVFFELNNIDVCWWQTQQLCQK